MQVNLLPEGISRDYWSQEKCITTKNMFVFVKESWMKNARRCIHFSNPCGIQYLIFENDLYIMQCSTTNITVLFPYQNTIGRKHLLWSIWFHRTLWFNYLHFYHYHTVRCILEALTTIVLKIKDWKMMRKKVLLCQQKQK